MTAVMENIFSELYWKGNLQLEMPVQNEEHAEKHWLL